MMSSDTCCYKIDPICTEEAKIKAPMRKLLLVYFQSTSVIINGTLEQQKICSILEVAIGEYLECPRFSRMS